MKIATKLTGINIKDLELSYKGNWLKNNDILGVVGINSMDCIEAVIG